MATPNYDINYDDERLTEVESDKNVALTENEELYGGMIEDSEAYYNSQIEASKEWADKQTEIQNEQTEFAIEKIEQQKEQANKDYLKEQSGSYVDWQKQSNQYGANAEKMAAGGLTNTGYSESSQVSMYNTYQNRVAVARQSYQQAVLNYDNSIKDARLQNNAALAQIAFESLQKQLELSLAGFQYKNTLLTEMAKQKTTIEQNYYNRYLAVLDQINAENELAEKVRQFEENKALEEAKLAEEKRQYDATLAEQQRQFNKSFEAQYSSGSIGGSSGGSSGGRSSTKSTQDARNEQSKIKNTKKNGTEGDVIKTEYYNAAMPKATKVAADKYGTFSNGYQPKGIAGHGKLKDSGDTIKIKTKTLSGKTKTVKQKVWRSESGVLWYWEGREMCYKRLPKA